MHLLRYRIRNAFVFAVIFTAALLSSSSAWSQEEPPVQSAPSEGAVEAPLETTPPAPPPSPIKWKASAELGFIAITGNTKSTTVNGGAKGEISYGSWGHEGAFEALFTQQDDPAVAGVNKQTTAQRFVVSEKTNYSITKRQYLFVTARYEDDKFSGFDWRLTESAGYGVKVVDEESVTLKIEAGPGGRHSHTPSSITPTLPADAQNEFTGRGALNFEWKISKTASFTEDATTVIGPKEGGGVVTESVSAVKAQIAGGLSLSASFTIQHTSNPPGLKKDIDTRTGVTLVYAFGSEQK